MHWSHGEDHEEGPPKSGFMYSHMVAYDETRLHFEAGLKQRRARSGYTMRLMKRDRLMVLMGCIVSIQMRTDGAIMRGPFLMSLSVLPVRVKSGRRRGNSDGLVNIKAHTGNAVRL